MALDPITGAEVLGGDLLSLIGKFVTDKDKAAELSAQITTLQVQADAAQTDVDKVEAASTNWFVAGWRPFLGWSLVLCVDLYFIPKFIVASIVYAHDCWAAGGLAGYPQDIGITDVIGLLTILLGHTWGRTLEKSLGVAR